MLNKMPSTTFPASPLVSIRPLSPELRKDTLIGAEVVLNDSSGLLNADALNPEDISVLRQALYDNSVLVLRKQQGIDPLALEKLAAIWDENIANVHSSGKEQVRDPRSILSRNNGARLQKAENVQIIGNGVFKGYEGLDLNLRHVVSRCLCSRTQNVATISLILTVFMLGLCRISCEATYRRSSSGWPDQIL